MEAERFDNFSIGAGDGENVIPVVGGLASALFCDFGLRSTGCASIRT
jgi:hypothetical protein